MNYKNKKVLDCTLRDGGYHTNWEFDDNLVQEIILALDKSDVDYIELGYKSPLPGGRFKRCDDKFISTLLKDIDYNVQLAFMIDVKDFIENDKVNVNLLLGMIQIKSKSPFSLCRIATNYETLDQTLELAEIISEAGYQTTVNLMKVSALNKEQVKDSLKKLGKSNVDMIYVADSLGSINEEKLKELLNLFRKTCIVNDKLLGFHPHNNLGLAFSNTIKAVELGVDIVDGTITGMGRGAGNLRIEQYLMFIKRTTNDLLDLIQRRFTLLKQKYTWGWSSNYMYTGMNEIHPTHASVSIIIPARYKSSRFPGKPIVDINGTPMVIRVADIASKVVPKENIYIATDDDSIAKVVDNYDYKVILTSDSCLTGTDRVCEAAKEIDSNIIVNIQGDEPLLDPNDIRKVIDEKLKYMDSVINCMSRLNSTGASNRNIPKVVANFNNGLVYISRSGIPGTKYGHSKKLYKQVCIYAFTKDELDKFYQYGLKNGKSPLEWTEDIEILRFVELGIKVKMIEVYGNTHAVDIPEDVKIVEEILNERGGYD